ncbi:hypothetical protein BSZ36_03215 [Rubricoccus marinus]|uniref:MobA-like NTP transferase domain-containing protein n=2 Tax=Rubricoccus marinus TaxID=716817 RepID=A0A259U3I1_9BACT|nr:hypothetical protein BSZ36_03215 [Rubricoccus marinus]
MPRENKLLADLCGEPVLTHVLRLASGAPFTSAVVVTGHDREAVESLASGVGLRTVHNAEWREGMGTSLAVGAKAVSPEADALAVLLGDVPLVRRATLERLWREASPEAIVRPIYRGQPGHPVVFGRAFLPDLLRVRGDDGARSVLQAHAAHVVRVPTDDEGVAMDADTPEALARLRTRF